MLKRPKNWMFTVFIFSFLLSLPNVFGLMVSLDKFEYKINETMTININSTSTSNVSILIKNSLNSLMDSFEINGSSLVLPYIYKVDLPPGYYTLETIQGSDNVSVDFKVVNQIISYDARLIGDDYVIFVNTSSLITTGNEFGGNFSDLLSLSKSGQLHYGKLINLTGDGKNYSFVLVDENIPGVYDSIWVDDDDVFLLYNSTEDGANKEMIETKYIIGDTFLKNYVFEDIEINSGNKLLLSPIINKSFFKAGDKVNFIVLIKNETKYLLPHIPFLLEIIDRENNVIFNISNMTQINGYAIISTTLPSNCSAGTYLVKVNGTPTEVFDIRNFKVFLKITDLNNKPMYVFTPHSKIRIWAITKNISNELFNASSISGTLIKPDGSGMNLNFNQVDTGLYYTEAQVFLTGKYRVVINVTDANGNVERVGTSFEVQTISFIAMTINPEYIGETDASPEAIMADTFAPGSNITIATFVRDITKLSPEGGPCGIDACIQIECKKEYYGLKLFDATGKLMDVNYTVMNISTFAYHLGKEPPEEPGVRGQCIIVIYDNNSWINTTGRYKVDIKLKHPIYRTHHAGETFSIQYLYATGGTVDFKGEDFTFLAPNSTIRIKLKIKDLITDEYIPDENILDAEIVEMHKHWPEFKDALKDIPEYNKAILNESINGSIISFLSPPEEGFYTAKIRFKVNLTSKNKIVEGSGTIFFELKKYLIWADPDMGNSDLPIIRSGTNITLKVYVMDVDKGVMFGETSPECTGCSGLIVSVENLRNEQLFKEFKRGVDFQVQESMILNSTGEAKVTIIPSSSLPSGWYSADIVVYDPAVPSRKYYGWGWFEIRNFFAYAAPVKWVNLSYIMEGKTTIYPTTSNSVLLSVMAFLPGDRYHPPQLLTIDNVSIENIQNVGVWPPKILNETKYKVNGVLYNQNIIDEGANVVNGVAIVNLSLLDVEPGTYLVNLRVTTSDGKEDIGTGDIIVADYMLGWEIVPQSKMYKWPLTYSNSENLTIRFIGLNFDETEHNLTAVKVRELFDESRRHPVRVNINENYTYVCESNTCEFNLSLKYLKGNRYSLRLCVMDFNDKERCIEDMWFEIKNFILGVPQIYDVGLWNVKDTPEKTLSVPLSFDKCYNFQQLSFDDCPFDNHTLCIWGGSVNISLPFDEEIGKQYYGGIFWVENQGPEKGQWRMGNNAPDSRPYICVVSNTTHLWINLTNDPYYCNLSSSIPLAKGDTFMLDGYPQLDSYIWIVKGVAKDNNATFEVRHANSIVCGGEQMEGEIKFVPPPGYENQTFYYSYNKLVEDGPISWSFRFLDPSSPTYNPRYVLIYHNTTHLWMARAIQNEGEIFVNFTNSTMANGPVPINGMIQDGYGGKWKVINLVKQSVKLYGENVLSSGIFVNTSLSKTGKFVFSTLGDEWFIRDKEGEGKTYFDLDGNGYPNGTLYILLIDNGSTYNTLAFSSDWNFTNESRIISVNENNRDKRRIGLNDTLVLLSIDPKVERLFLYTDKMMGDWSELGEYRVGSNITIPVMITTTEGTPTSANVTIKHVKHKSASTSNIKEINYLWKEITGAGELFINLSEYNLSTGDFEFEIVAEKNNNAESLEEWMWPRATMRAFLVETRVGYGKTFTNKITSTKLWRFSPEFGDIPLTVYILNRTSDPFYPVIKGAVAFIEPSQLVPDPALECNFVIPADADLAGNNYTYKIREFEDRGAIYYIYLNQNNQTKIWIKKNDCNFTGETARSEGDPVNITIQNNTFMLYFLNVTINKTTIGLANFELDTNPNILPIEYEPRPDELSPIWYLMGINASGHVYDVILVNTTDPSPICLAENIMDCVKGAVFDSDGDLSSYNAFIKAGENITGSEFFLISIGPSMWDGITLANLSKFGGFNKLPVIWAKVQDDTPIDIAYLNESEVNFDLNLDKDLDDEFYILALDNVPDGISKITNIMVDDDNKLVDLGSWNGTGFVQYELYGNEKGKMSEMWGTLPNNMWYGWIQFGESDNVSWEESPQYNLLEFDPQYNKIRIMKDVWDLKKEKNISIFLRVYDFDQSPIQGATVSIERAFRFSDSGFEDITNDLIYKNDTMTDEKGYYMIYDMNETSGFKEGIYMITLNVLANGNGEVVDAHYHIS